MAIELLKGAAIELARGYVSGHREERDRVEIRVGECNGEIGGTGAAGGKGRGRPSGDAVVHVGHEPSYALVMDGNGLDLVGALIQRVDEPDVAVPAQTEHVRYLLANQIVDDHLTAIEHVPCHCFLSLQNSRSATFQSQPGSATGRALIGRDEFGRQR